jgi:chromate transport protein ChrA
MPGIVISVVLCSLLIMSILASIRALLDAVPYVRALARSLRAGFAAADAHAKIGDEVAKYKMRTRRGGIF